MFYRHLGRRFFYIINCCLWLHSTCSFVPPLPVAGDVYEVAQSSLLSPPSLRAPQRVQRLARSIEASTAAKYYDVSTELDRDAVASFWDEQRAKAKPLITLNATHRRGKTIGLHFEFPFYGENVRELTIATGGFINTAEHVEPTLLAATQYIAPLMANFGTTPANDSNILISRNSTALTVLWQNVELAHMEAVGKFSFSATLHKSGDIVFTYLTVPVSVNELDKNAHPVLIGLSDAYLIREMQRRTLHEYTHLVLPAITPVNMRIVYLKALPNCLQHTDCTTCSQHEGNMQCQWCAKLRQCSAGLSRRRQAWLTAGCDKSHVDDTASCASLTSPMPAPSTSIESLESEEVPTSKLPMPRPEFESDELAATKSELTTMSSPTTMSPPTTTSPPTTALPLSKPRTESVGARQNNARVSVRDHTHYSSQMGVNKQAAAVLWPRFLKMPIDDELSTNYAAAKNFKLSFDFPYYGEMLRDVIVSSSGFISTSDSMAPPLMLLQRIAPLSGNFDPRMSSDANVRVEDNGTAFTVLWHKMPLHGRPELGEFSFSATLLDNGNIIFLYYAVPTALPALATIAQPINVGLSNVFVINEEIIDEHATTRTVRVPYTLGDVHLPLSEVFNTTEVYLRAVPGCQKFNDCGSCVAHTVGELRCAWCPALQRCSTGIDRGTQQSREHACPQNKIGQLSSCPAN